MSKNEYEKQLIRTKESKNKLQYIHKLFEELYFIGIGSGTTLNVYEEKLDGYQYLLTTELPMEMPARVRAAFMIDDVKDCCCIVSPDCLDEEHGYIALLHEMVHCYQFRRNETEHREKLQIYQEAKKKNDFMWELNYPFPYENTELKKFIRSVTKMDFTEIRATLMRMKNYLEKKNCEYMIWQMWKEGFARFIENKIRAAEGICEELGGNDPEKINRVSFYFLGDFFWRKYSQGSSDQTVDIDEGFHILLNCAA